MESNDTATTLGVDTTMRMSEDPETPRDLDLWFDDGSVVLRAKDPPTLFRVHRAMIARHSEVFRNMFSMPQPEDLDIETIEGCPVVALHDSAKDINSLLRALYDGPNWGDNGPEDFDAVAGVLRLSHKYMVDSLRTKAIEHLHQAWPTSLQGWDAREEFARRHRDDLQTLWRSGERRYPHPTRVIDLAREVNAPTLLPSAFYDMSRSTFAVIFENNPSLTLADTQKLAIGKEASHNAVTSLITTLGTGRSTTKWTNVTAGKSWTCNTSVLCRKDFLELVELATQHYLFDRERGSLDPLYVAEELGQLKSAEYSECKACAYALEHWSSRERERIWKNIPSWFKLDGWDCCE